MSGALILTGAPGSGKSSVLDALCTLLEIEAQPFGAIESEQFSRGCPWLSCAEWLPQLAAVVRLQREAGRSTFLVAATTENVEELHAVSAAVAAERQLVVCLRAPVELIADRIEAREPDQWPGKAALVEHARTLADLIPAIPGIDLVISTAVGSASDIAGEIRDALIENSLLPVG